MQLPSYLQQYQAPDIGAALSANLGSAMPPHVSIEGGRFKLIDASNNEIPVPTFDPVLGVYLDACIIDVNDKMSRMFYIADYDPSAAGAPPDCWSDNGVGPSMSSSSPQSPTCAACPKAVWGSKISNLGSKIPACSQKQKTALLVPGFQTLFLLAVPPNSHKFMREYVEKCRGSGINMANLITRISFVPGVQGTLQFQPVTYIDEPTAVLRQAAYAEKKTDALVGRNDVARPAAALAAPVSHTAPAIAPPPNSTGQAPLLSTQPGSTMQVEADPFAALAQTAQPASPTGTGAGFATQPASSSEPAPAQRRRRRTAAEVAAANGAPANGQAAQQPAAAPQAPFPHPGQATQNPGQAVNQNPSQGSFGIAQGQPAAANPELSDMLDDFFKQG